MNKEYFNNIFFPRSIRARDKALENGNRFAYYTTAEVAFQIIKNKRIWMRNTTTMNDYKEINYGTSLLNNSIESPAGDNLKNAINNCHPNLFDAAWKKLTDWLPGLMADTFITCVSEHDQKEDGLGRLSMWRAYGGTTGVAIIINGAPFHLETNELGAYAGPVSYLNQEQFSASINEIAENINSNTHHLKPLPFEQLKEILFVMFRFSILCTKHPGFAEEREWRIVASPALHPKNLLESDVAIVRGVPQPILKIPLVDVPEKGLVGLEPKSLIHEIIIGPCDYPHVTYRALWAALNDSGIEHPERLIERSEIPLRHN